ncbi:MAG: phosphate ABC transporter substrate-binding protein [Spirochaetaceae bacterium]|jgi:phosphate transport system substrate-binding protein|nr:phosphate ABC transporter substrate-binding protein [Spirochaetaceae bacterium]
MKVAITLLLGIGLAGQVFAGASKDGKTPAGSQVYTMEIAGSTSVTPLMELLAGEYGKTHPNLKININGTGSSDGIKAAAEGTSELGMSSRELTPAEKGAGLDERVIAVDGIAVIVHPANPIADLTLEQIRGIYSGGIPDWRELGDSKTGKIAVVSREPGSGTRGAFEELINLKDKLLLGATEFDGTGAIKAEISRNQDAIGYISLGSLDPSVKALTVQGAAATSDNVRNSSYPIARPFIIVSKKTLSPEGTQFLNWILSSEGQKIVGKNWISVR